MEEGIGASSPARPEYVFAAVVFLLHCCAHSKAVFRAARKYLSASYAVGRKEAMVDAHKVRVDKAVAHQNEKNFSIACSFIPHCVPMILPLLLTMQHAKAFLVQVLGAYVILNCTALKVINMPTSRIRIFGQTVYLVWVAHGWEARLADFPESTTILSAMTLCRIMLVVILIESRFHIPGQIAITASLILSKIYVRGCTSSIAFLACSEGFTLVMVISLSILVENNVRGQFYAQFKSSDAEAMVAGFRRMLRGICDGELLLDANLCIKGRSTCLQRIMSKTIDGDVRFPELLVESEEEICRFQEFINTSSKMDLGEDIGGTPPCLRVSLQGKANISVGVDLFHVPLPNLYGSDDTYHLVALRQDTEPEPIPDARPSDIPRRLLRYTRLSSATTSQAMSSAASSSGASSASEAAPGVIHGLPQLTEMMLVVDTSRRRQDVRQVHLNYDPVQAEDPGMPCLRHFIRPTDWESLRSKVKSFAATAKAAEHPLEMEPKLLRKGVWFRAVDEPHGYIKAERAKLSIHSSAAAERARGVDDAPKVWLYLADFAEPNRPAPSVAMSGISELQEC